MIIENQIMLAKVFSYFLSVINVLIINELFLFDFILFYYVMLDFYGVLIDMVEM